MVRKQKRGNPDWAFGEFAVCLTLIKNLLRHLDNLDSGGVVGLGEQKAQLRKLRHELNMAQTFHQKRMTQFQKKLDG